MARPVYAGLKRGTGELSPALAATLTALCSSGSHLVLQHSSITQFVHAMTGAQSVPGGIAKANLNVIVALSCLAEETGRKLTILSLLEGEADRPRSLPSSVAFKSFQGNQKLFAASMLRAISGHTIFSFDHVSLALPLLPFAAAGLAHTVIFNHGSESWKRIQRLNRLSIRYATRCLTNSHFTLTKMREHLGNFNGVACQLGLPPDFHLNVEIVERNGNPLQLAAADNQTYTMGERMLLLVARMLPTEREKGHLQLLEVFPEVLKRYPDVQLVFAGDGPDRERFKQGEREKGIASSVFIPGFLPSETLRRLYQYCYAFVMPSKQEGFGLAYLEAMNYAKPCLGCFDQGTEEVVVHDETGVLVHEPNNANELCRALDRLLTDPQTARAMGRKGFERLHQNFTSAHHQSRVKTELVAVLRDLR